MNSRFHQVSYFNAISYVIDDSDQEDRRVVQVRITVGMVVEVAVAWSDHGEYAKVVGIMRHNNRPWFLLRWLTQTGRTHPHLGVPKYKLEDPREHSYHSITIVDNQRFCDSVHFYYDSDLAVYYRNDFTYNII
jgi:hypothetical protein